MKTSKSYQEVTGLLRKAHKGKRTFTAREVKEGILDPFILRYEEETKPDNGGKWLLDYLFECTKIRRKALNKVKLKARLKTFTPSEIKRAILNASKSEHHMDNGFRYMTSEFFTRNDDIIDKWLNVPDNNTHQKAVTLKDSLNG